MRPRSGTLGSYVRLLAVLALGGSAAALLACGPSDREETSSPLPEGTPVEVAAEPTIDVGVGPTALDVDAAEQFHDVRAPFLLDDGRLAVPDGGSKSIRVFDSAGSFVRSLGGAGQGPGEFRRLDEAWHRGDTIEAWDWTLGRLTRFFPGDSLEVVGFEGGSGPRQVVPGTLSDGWVVAEVESATMGGRDEMAVQHFGPDGSRRGLIARVRGMSRYRTSFGGGPDPLSPQAVLDVANGRVFVAETLTPEIRVLTPSGDPVRTIRWEPDPRPSPEEAARQTIEAIVARGDPLVSGGSSDGAELRKRLRAYPVREEVSAFWSFLVDEEGFVWVQPYDPRRHSIHFGVSAGATGPGGEWIVFSPGGRRLTSVRMPEGLRPTEITADAVVGIRRNDVGVETVQVHPLERR